MVITTSLRNSLEILNMNHIELESKIKEEEVEHAGGFIVQLMPDAVEENIAKLEENVGKLESVTTMLRNGNTPEDILNIVLDGLNPRILDTCEV